MSENVAVPLSPKKPRTRMLVIGLSALILLLIYGAGVIVLPITILYNVQNRHCNSVLSLDGIYTKLYPAFLRDETVPAPVKECKAYTRALSNEEKELWPEAYAGYQDYSSTYPKGMYFQD